MLRRVFLALALLLAAHPTAAAGGGGGTDAVLYVRFEAIIIPVFDSARVSGLVSVTVNLRVDRPEDKQAIEADRPRFINAYRLALAEVADLYISPRHPLQVTMIHQAIQRATDKLYPKHPAKALIVDASVRAM